jgi:hypothetical protein
MERQDKNSEKKVRLNSSPERHTFQKQKYIERCKEEGKEPSKSYIKMYEQHNFDKLEREENPEWQENNMEYDLRSTPWICDKVKESRVYAQNLYASMCNNEFQKNDMMPILKDQRWGCSWRYAGGIVADMDEKGDYIDWYCSGIRNNDEMTPEEFANLTEEQQTFYKEGLAYVPESVVTDEIRRDLKKLGWLVCEDLQDE